jgi:hypothetical protein
VDARAAHGGGQLGVGAIFEHEPRGAGIDRPLHKARTALHRRDDDFGFGHLLA